MLAPTLQRNLMKRLSHNLIKLCTQNKIKHNIALKQPTLSSFSTSQQLSLSALDAIESGTSAAFLETLELQWRKDANSVDPLWAEYFDTISKGQELSDSFLNRLRRSLQQQRQKLIPAGEGAMTRAGDENLKNFSLKTEIISLVRCLYNFFTPLFSNIYKFFFLQQPTR